MVRFRIWGALAFAGALTLFGCSQTNPNAPARVHGRVTYNGNPVTGGTLEFHTKDGGKIPAAIGADGEYSAFDIPDGEMVVTVDTETLNPNRKEEEYKGQSKGAFAKYGKMGVVKGGKAMPLSPAPEGAAPAGAYMKIPDQYRDPAKSPLKVTLKKGEQRQDFNLTD